MSNNHNGLVKEQLLHLLFGTLVFVALGSVAVGLDLAAKAIRDLGVSEFTHVAIEYTAHGMLVLDLLLFASYLAKSSYLLVKEMFQ